MSGELGLPELRRICLAFPEAEEAGGVGNTTFKVRGKIFFRTRNVGCPQVSSSIASGNPRASLRTVSFRMPISAPSHPRA